MRNAHTLDEAETMTDPTEIIFIEANFADGIESRVAVLRDGRFSVTLRDIDADMVVDCARIFTDQNLAVEFAHEIVA